MKRIMLAGAAMMCFATAMSGAAIAQDMPATSEQPAGTEAPPPPTDPSAGQMPGQADPNAGQPTGAVPPGGDMQPAPPGVPNDPSAPVGSASNPVTTGGNMTPPPTEAKDYPVCSKTVQDSCINPGDARKAGKANRKSR
ncbi:MAG: Fe-S oxidoreductase [Sphingobium sp.]